MLKIVQRVTETERTHNIMRIEESPVDLKIV